MVRTLNFTKALSVIGLLATSSIISGCYGPITPSFYTETISIRVDQDANNDSATAVDFVVVYDEALLKEILALTSEKYFAGAKQYRRDYPQQIEVFHWEVVPGQFINAERLHYKRSSPLAGIVFARYIAPGDHRFRLGSQEYLQIHLMKDGFEVFPVESDQAPLSSYKESE